MILSCYVVLRLLYNFFVVVGIYPFFVVVVVPHLTKKANTFLSIHKTV